MSLITPVGFLKVFGRKALFEPSISKKYSSKGPRCEGFLIFGEAIKKSTEYKELRKAVYDAAAAEFKPAQMADKKFLKKVKWCLKPVDAEDEDGDMQLKAWTKEAPPVVNANNEYVTVPGDVWSGQLARFEIALKAYEVEGSYSVTAFLNSVQITKSKMPRLDGRKPGDKVFSKIEDEAGESQAGDDPFN